MPVLKVLIKKPEQREIYENMVDFKQPIILPPDISDYESKLKQITRLLEKLEMAMIEETYQRVQKEAKLVQAERAREESTITSDLWKKAIMKEEFTINKPHIAEDFSRLLFNALKLNEPSSSLPIQAQSTTSVNTATTSQSSNINQQQQQKPIASYTINEADLKDCLTKLGGWIQERERSNFEQYTMFYENLLRQHHQFLYYREREVLSLSSQLEQRTAEMNVEVQCEMADACYDLIMGLLIIFISCFLNSFYFILLLKLCSFTYNRGNCVEIQSQRADRESRNGGERAAKQDKSRIHGSHNRSS
mgnify:CR=1 FL=1